MENSESIADFLSRAMAIASQMRAYGERISDETIVTKLLQSLTSKFDHVVAAIEEGKDLSMLSVDELMGSLQAHESRINRSFKKNEEKAFQVKVTTIDNEENYNSATRGRGRGGFRSHGFGRGRGRGRNDGQRQHGNMRSGIQCYNCNGFRHIKADCWYKYQQMNFVAENHDEEKLFYRLYRFKLEAKYSVVC